MHSFVPTPLPLPSTFHSGGYRVTRYRLLFCARYRVLILHSNNTIWVQLSKRC